MYGWDKRNVFNQKHYGLVRARVAVGYQYESRECSGEPVWTVRTVDMKGYEVDISDVGKAWNLQNHHHYNAVQGN